MADQRRRGRNFGSEALGQVNRSREDGKVREIQNAAPLESPGGRAEILGADSAGAAEESRATGNEWMTGLVKRWFDANETPYFDVGMPDSLERNAA